MSETRSALTEFQSTPLPTGRSDKRRQRPTTTPCVSIHAPPNRKERLGSIFQAGSSFAFQSTPLPTGRSDLGLCLIRRSSIRFQSTPLPTGRSDACH